MTGEVCVCGKAFKASDDVEQHRGICQAYKTMYMLSKGQREIDSFFVPKQMQQPAKVGAFLSA